MSARRRASSRRRSTFLSLSCSSVVLDMQTFEMRNAKFGLLNRCIYGDDEDHFDPNGYGDEHIIPIFLGQKGYIKNASCHKCERETSGVESYCAKEIFGELRAHHKIKGRKRSARKRCPHTSFPMKLTLCGKQSVHKVEAKYHPSLLVLPSFPWPGIMLNKEPNATWNDGRIHCWQFGPARRLVGEYLAEMQASEWEVSKTTKIFPFVRLIAKIGHAFAIATCGYGSFQPMLPPLILGKSDAPNAAYLVGGELEAPPPSEREHELGIIKVDNSDLLVAYVRLFANIGTPAYYAVVGRDLRSQRRPE